ncbi:hypothetical protein J6590_103662 [Homalodisca vitripennis]|nr:hypothetical protein J6590_103662 [Homalodisca vitripennis]
MDGRAYIGTVAGRPGSAPPTMDGRAYIGTVAGRPGSAPRRSVPVYAVYSYLSRGSMDRD